MDKSGPLIVWVIFRLLGTGGNRQLLMYMFWKKNLGILEKRHISIPNLLTKLFQKKFLGSMNSKSYIGVRDKIWYNNIKFPTF